MANDWKSQNCLARIHWHLPALPPAERRVAQYVLDNPETVLSMTMESLAERARASYATVNRFCRRLEYTGYRDFQRGLLAYLTGERDISQMTQELTVHTDRSVRGLCGSVHRLTRKVLDDTFELIDPATVEAAAHALVAAKRIVLAGVGSSGLAAQYVCSRLFRIGLNCHYAMDGTLNAMQASLLGEGDVLFAISSSGRTARVVEMAALARRSGATVVGLSDFCVTPLAQECDYNLFTTGRSPGLLPDRDVQFLTGQFAILDVLYLYCRTLRGETARQADERTLAVSRAEKLPDKPGGGHREN